MIRIFIISLLMFLLPSIALGQVNSVDLTDLTQEQRALLVIEAEKMRSKSSEDISANLSEYAEIGQKYGIALVATAKELGVAADELLDTTVGKVGLVLIIWKVAGESLLGLAFGLLWLTTMLPLWIYYFRRQVPKYARIHYTYYENGKRKTKETIPVHEDAYMTTKWMMMFLLLFVIMLPSVIMVF